MSVTQNPFERALDGPKVPFFNYEKIWKTKL